MERIIFIILSCWFSISSYAQLKVAVSYNEQQENAKMQEKAKQDSIYEAQKRVHYDSLQAYPVGEAVYSIIGQKVMVKGYTDGGSSSHNGVKFFKNPSIRDIYYPSTKDTYRNNYDICFKWTSTKYSSVSGRIFTITNVVNYDDSYENDGKNHGVYNLNAPPKLFSKDSYVFIELVDEKDTLYYLFDKYSKYPDFPFNIEGYVMKRTELRKGIKYAKCINMDEYTDTDFYTGKTIRFYVGQIWQLKEIVIDPKDGDLVELYTNSKGEVYRAPKFTFDVAFKTKKESDRIKAKYGDAIWKAIMTFTIHKGMSKSAVRESWGEPNYINDASYGEQWVYDDKYVYFRNGRVTGWN